MSFLDPASIREWRDGDYVVTTDRARVDLDVVHPFLANESYWGHGRTREYDAHVVACSSRLYSMLHAPTARQVGFARVVTDGAWYAWIGDVFVLPEHRGGRGKFLLRCVSEDLEPIRRVMLDTRDAHGLYSQFGFGLPRLPETLMERFRENVSPRS